MNINIVDEKMILHNPMLFGRNKTVNSASLYCNLSDNHGTLWVGIHDYEYLHAEHVQKLGLNEYMGFVRPYRSRDSYYDTPWYYVSIQVPITVDPIEQKIKEIADKYSKNLPESSNIKFDLEQLVKEAKKQP